MKKIMFNDKYGLTQAVLEGRKTQTRRLFTLTLNEGDLYGDLKEVYPDKVFRCVNRWMFEYKKKVYDIPAQNYPKYSVGEIVAVAQSYKDAGYSPDDIFYRSIHKIDGYIKETACSQKGWNNKILVAPNMMPHQIRITNVRVERLQDISDKDCLADGIERLSDGGGFKPYAFYDKSIKVKSEKEGVNYGWYRSYDTPREAYAALIDKVSGKGTWEKNPYVFVYDFKLIK